jgi:uncharacterized protein
MKYNLGWLSALILSVAILISCMILANAYRQTHQYNQSISVTGLAQQNFVSDLIVWDGSFSRKSNDLPGAYDQLKKDEQMVQTFLHQNGINDSEVVFSTVNLNKEYRYVNNQYGASSQTFDGYTLTENVHIQSKDISKIEKIIYQITEMIKQGVEFYSQPPQYYYTKLSDLKINLLAAASSDGLMRARQIASNSGSELGDLKKATMGVFQITGQNSSEGYSYGGTFNTIDKNKTGTITVRMDFSIH